MNFLEMILLIFFSKLFNKNMDFKECFEIIYSGFTKISMSDYRGLFWNNTYFKKWDKFLEEIDEMSFICFRFLILNENDNPIYIRYFNLDRFFKEPELLKSMNSSLII